MKADLSIALITHNEADRLPGCLESLSFADEIVVVDSGSTDGTVEIAQAAGCRVFVEPWKEFGPQKQSAVDKCVNQWVLIIDADERIAPETAREITRVILQPDADAYSFPRKNYYHGRWIRSCGWWPDRVVRLFRKDRACVDNVPVHETVTVRGTVCCLDTPIIHDSMRDLCDVIRKMNSYSTLGAKKLLSEGSTTSVPMACGKGLVAFLKCFIIKKGFRDGAAGFILSFCHGVNTCFKYLKLRELHQPQWRDPDDTMRHQ